MEKVIIKTKDGLDIVGDYYNLSKLKKGILLLHMMPADRKSWRDLAIRLEDENCQVLAIDLRGHGESSWGPEGYKKFTDEEHQKSILDVEAGVEFFKTLGFDLKDIIIGGASIGANLALWYASENYNIKKIFCLSPGLNYRGIQPLNFISKFNIDQKILIISSYDDINKKGINNAEESKKIFDELEVLDKKIIIYGSAGHGTDMFFKNKDNEPDLIKEIVKWIRNE